MEVDAHPALEAQRLLHADHTERIDELQKYFGKKLYHQLTEKLIEYLSTPALSAPSAVGEVLDFFQEFVKPLDGKLDKVKFVQILAIVCKSQPAAKALEIILPFEASTSKNRDPKYMWTALHAEKLISSGQTDAAKEILDTLAKEVADAYEVDAIIQSTIHRTCAMLWKALNRPQDFFRSSILYLSYTPIAAIPVEQRPTIAFEVGVAALIAPEEYEFAELLQQELVISLTGSEHEWLKDLLQAFGEGSFSLFDEARAVHKAKIQATQALNAAESVIRTKMEALALMELAFRKPKKQRRLTFAEIADHCRVGPKAVEFLVMKAMCANLIRGQIDEVQQIVMVTWVKPRILDTTRIEHMREHMDAWAARTGLLLDHLEEMTPELLVS